MYIYIYKNGNILVFGFLQYIDVGKVSNVRIHEYSSHEDMVILCKLKLENS